MQKSKINVNGINLTSAEFKDRQKILKNFAQSVLRDNVYGAISNYASHTKKEFESELNSWAFENRFGFKNFHIYRNDSAIYESDICFYKSASLMK